MSLIQFKRGAAGAELPPLLPGEPVMTGGSLYVADAEGRAVKLSTAVELEGHTTDAVRHVTEAERAAWNAGGGDPSVFDVVIRTQAEFEALIASPTWLDAVSVCFVGDGGTLKFTRSDGLGCKIPQTVKQIVGLNVATIEVTNFSSDVNSWAALYYETLPGPDHYIEGMTVNCTAKYANEHAYAFRKCVRLIRCSGSGVATGAYSSYAFATCAQLTECVGTASGRGCCVFHKCDQLVNCSGTGTADERTAGITNDPCVFYRCTQLVNYTGVSRAINSPTASSSRSYAFSSCAQLTNCTGTGTCTGGGTLYGNSFFECSYLNGCKQGDAASTTGFLGGANTKVDNATVVAV